MPFTQPKTLKFARGLRRDMTPAETRLWSMLRGRRAQGFKFRRQEPIGPYVADFVCRECKLIVEVDGATHSTTQELARDARRTSWLEAQGFRVYRVLNTDVFERLNDVMDGILVELGESKQA